MIYRIRTDDNKTVATFDYVRPARLYDLLREYAKDAETHSAVLDIMGVSCLAVFFPKKGRCNFDRSKWRCEWRDLRGGKLQPISASEARDYLKQLGGSL